MTKRILGHLQFFMLALALCAFAAPVHAAVKKGSKAAVAPVEQFQNNPFNVTLGKAELINIDEDFSDVLVANPSIIDVSALNSRKLYIVGTNIGDTNIFILDEEGEVIRKIDIHVTYDLLAMQRFVDTLFPDEEIMVKSVSSQVYVTGTVSTPEKATRVTDAIAHYVSEIQDLDNKEVDQLISNALSVRGEQQVTLRVKIVEASRSIIKELGLETRLNDGTDIASSVLGLDNVFGQLLANNQLGLTRDPFAVGELEFDTGLDGLGLVEFTLNALEQENLINTLAEPNLTTVSGETAGFLAGGEFPVPVGRDRDGNLVIEFRPFGVSLNFRPTVMSAERISLQLETEVSALNFEDGIPLTGTTSTASVIPAFDVRRASTTVEIGSGGSLMIAGLLRSDATKGLTGLPGINDTPILGDLMSSDSFLRDESEVMIIITPYLVEPVADASNSEQSGFDHDVPEKKSNPLADAFLYNVRRVYALREEDEDDVFEDSIRFGYLLN